MGLPLTSGRRKSPPPFGASPLSPEATSNDYQSYNFQSFSTLPCLLFRQQQVNPTTREEEKRVLYEIAFSHLARRTFVGNLYKQVKGPNLVGALSGPKEGSRAFARYRAIDDEMKKELVNLLK